MTVLIHAAAWVLLFSLPALLRPSHNPNETEAAQPVSSTVFFFISRVSDVLLIGFFYLNALVLIPRFLYKRKYLVYPLSVIFYFLVYVMIMWSLWVNFT